MNFKQRLEQYRNTYEIDDIENPNDIANLHIIINNQELLDMLQKAINDELKGGNVMQSMDNLRKLQDTRRQIVEQNMALEKMLGIDRKTRKKDTQDNVGDYIAFVKNAAREFLERHYINVSCTQCKVMVGRIIPVHDHTEFNVQFQCSQCKKMVQVKRKEQDTFFDIKERNKNWRNKYPVEIEQGKADIIESDDDEVLEDD